MSFRDDLKAYQDGELSPERMEEVRVALTQDEGLQKEYEFMKFLSSEIKAAIKEPAIQGRPADVPLAAAKPKRWGVPQWSLAVASGVVVIALIGLLGPKQGFDNSGADMAKTTSTTSPASADTTAPAQNLEKSPEDTMGLKKSMVPPGAVATTTTPSASTEAAADAAAAPAAGGATTSGWRRDSNEPAVPAGAQLNSPETGVDATKAAPEPTVAGGAAKAKVPSTSTFVQGSDVTGSAQAKAITTPIAPEQVPNFMHDIVRTATEDIKVKNVRDAVDEVTKTVSAMQGFVGQSNQSMTDGNSVATIHVQVPSTAYDSFITGLRHMGEVQTEQTSGTDVTGQEIGTQSQIDAYKEELANLQKDLQNAHYSSEKADIRDRIRDVQANINLYNAQQNDTKMKARYATFDITFREKSIQGHGQTGDWMNDSLSGSSDILGFVGAAFGRGLIYVLVLSPIWLPIAGVIWWFARKAKKNS